MHPQVTKSLCLLLTGTILSIVLIVLGEAIVPDMLIKGLHDKLTKDTQSKLDEWTDDPTWGTNTSMSFTVYNLTNAREMQTVTPAPKPHFEAIEVPFTKMVMTFDASSTSGGDRYLYHEVTKYVPTNAADLDLEIVQVNPAYLGTMYAVAPSESIAFLGLAHEILSAANQVLQGFAGVVLADPTTSAPLVAGAEQMLGVPAGTIGTDPNMVAAAQFGSGVFMNLATASATQTAPTYTTASVASHPTLAAMGVCTPPEINTWINDVTSGPFAPGGALAGLLAANGFEFSSFSMSLTEAATFLATFTSTTGVPAGVPNWAAVLGGFVQQYVAAATSGDTATLAALGAMLYSTDPTTSPTGALFGATYGTLKVNHLASGATMDMCSSTAGGNFCPVLAAAYAAYLTSYLPESFFIGCKLLGCADGSCMRSDGTYPLNSGLFTRRTLGEMLHGHDDALFSAVPASAVPAGMTLEFNGLLGKFTDSNTTLASLRAAIASGAENASRWSYEFDSGKRDVENVNKWVARLGSDTIVPGHEDYAGWGTNGIPGEPFVVSGLRQQTNNPPQVTPTSPMKVIGDNFELTPNFGAEFSFYLTTIRRPVTIACDADETTDGLPGRSVQDCAFHRVKGINALKYTVPADLLTTKLNGEPSATCRGTVSSHFAATMPASLLPATAVPPTCDYLMRHDGVINLEVSKGAPFAVTQAYLHGTDPTIRSAVSMTRKGDATATELQYVAANDELALFVDPISGATIKGYERLQLNFYIERTLLDSARYANVFSADTDHGDSFVWPFLYIKQSPTITDDDAVSYKAAIYDTFSMGVVIAGTGIGLLLLTVLLVAARAAILARTSPAVHPGSSNKTAPATSATKDIEKGGYMNTGIEAGGAPPHRAHVHAPPTSGSTMAAAA
jgi:hypothetical protein